MKYQWILFDADGTLFDYDRAEATALERTFLEFGRRFESDYAEVYRRINSTIWLEFERGRISQQALRTRRFEQLFDALGMNVDAALFSASYLNHLAEGTDLIDGAEDVVRALYDKAHLLLITNGLTEVQRPRFAASTIHRYFDDILISEEVGAAKPAPGIFDIAFERMGWPSKESVLIVGDSLTSDIEGGSSYGIDTCWYNPLGRPQPANVTIRYEIGHLRELLELVNMV